MADNNKKLPVKLMVDKEKNRVAFAESNHEFVDILFSFLTVPVATVIRISGENSSSLGSFANIYRSVENLDSHYFHTEACKTMLLRPRNAAEVLREDLIINIRENEPRTIYTCSSCIGNFYYSSIPGTRCSCGNPRGRTTRWERTENKAQGDGVFVKEIGSTFIISDDLNVVPASIDVFMSQLKSTAMKDGSMLEGKVLHLGPEEIERLLWRSLISKSPLTDLLFSKTDKEDAENKHIMKNMVEPNAESDADCNSKEIQLKLLLSKMRNKVMYAEVDEDMVDFLFSTLTFPLGLLIKNTILFPKGCIVNLYRSVENNDYIKSEECKSMLLSPKLPAYYGCNSHLLNTEEMASRGRNVQGIYWYGMLANFTEANPKLPNNVAIPGGGCVKGLGKYMMTDNLHIAPLSLITSFQMINELNISAKDLVKREAKMGLSQALDLLSAAFCSHTALSDIFAPDRRQKMLPRLG